MSFNRNLWWKIFRAIPSHFQNETLTKTVMSILKSYNIPYMVDQMGNIFNCSFEGMPLLSAHMDSMQDVMYFPSDMRFERDIKEGMIFRGDNNIGADDKVGLYLALNILKDNPINFLFTQYEESGCQGSEYWIKYNSNLLKNITFGLVLDRRGAHDIICTNNNYGTKEFETDLVMVSDEGGHGFQPTSGSVSDANNLSKYISCANLSVGYYNPHQSSEYVIMKEVHQTEEYVKDIIESMGITEYDKPKSKYNYSGYQSRYKSGYNYDYYKDFATKDNASKKSYSEVEVEDLDKDDDEFFPIIKTKDKNKDKKENVGGSTTVEKEDIYKEPTNFTINVLECGWVQLDNGGWEDNPAEAKRILSELAKRGKYTFPAT